MYTWMISKKWYEYEFAAWYMYAIFAFRPKMNWPTSKDLFENVQWDRPIGQ